MYASPSGTNISSVSTAGMRTGITRGGSLDIGFYHRDTNRLKLTIELFVNFNKKSGLKSVGDIMCLMMRTMGSKESDPSSGPRISPKKLNPSSLLESFCSSGVIWSLCVDKEGSLIWTMGGIPGIGKTDKEHSLRSAVGIVPLEGVISPGDENGDENGGHGPDGGQSGTWTHIAAVVDCTSSSFSETEYLDSIPTSCTVTLYVNSEKVASGVIQVPGKKESELALPGVLYIGPCLPAGSRLTETRVVRRNWMFAVFELYVYQLTNVHQIS